MANKVSSNQPFGNTGATDGIMSIVVTTSTGSAQLQKLAGNDPDNDTWVDVTDGLYTSNAEDTIRAPFGQQYRFTLTGDAAAYFAG